MKKIYTQPYVEVENVKVEKGFATSTGGIETGFGAGSLEVDDEELEF